MHAYAKVDRIDSYGLQPRGMSPRSRRHLLGLFVHYQLGRRGDETEAPKSENVYRSSCMGSAYSRVSPSIDSWKSQTYTLP